MKEVLYPAVFHKEENKYWVEFPDLEGCFSEGDTLQEAHKMAQDALYCYLQEIKGEYPDASLLNKITLKKGDVVQLVSPKPYLKKVQNKFI